MDFSEQAIRYAVGTAARRVSFVYREKPEVIYPRRRPALY